jgi:hypothetical protein
MHDFFSIHTFCIQGAGTYHSGLPLPDVIVGRGSQVHAHVQNGLRKALQPSQRHRRRLTTAQEHLHSAGPHHTLERITPRDLQARISMRLKRGIKDH